MVRTLPDMFTAAILVRVRLNHVLASHDFSFMVKTMKKHVLTLTLSTTLILSACQTTGTGGNDWLSATQNILGSGLFQSTATSSLSNTEISTGLREALRIGTSTVVSQLGQSGGFSNDPQIKIPLPSQLQSVDDALSKFGLGSLTADLKNRMNEAAEIATPRAKELFFNAISSMTINDAQNILTGPNDAATSFLRRTMGAELSADISPIVQNALSQAGAVQAYDNVIGQYSAMPFVPDVKADLNAYVVDKAMDGIFYYVAQEEAAIRANPAKRTTEILQKVFGSVQ